MKGLHANPFRRLALIVGGIAWLGAATYGFYAVAAHAATPGAAPSVASSNLDVTTDSEFADRVRISGRATLVMVAHPHCPCTRASLHELERVLGKTPATATAADVVILFAGGTAARERDRVASDLYAIASAIPNARVVDDVGGVQAARLGVRTSGTVVFYDHAGTRRFAGGITASRGHEGDNAGADALRALLLKEASAAATPGTSPTGSPVYGCAIATP